MKARFWGTRGLLATPGEEFLRFGGATLCIELVNDAGARLVIDLGTGCIPLGASLVADAARDEARSGGKSGSKKLAVVLSSTRIDHIHGLPFFAPALAAGWNLTIMGPSQAGQDISGILDGQLNPNYSPLYGVQNLTAKIDLLTLTEGELSWDGFRIVTRELPHGRTKALGFRIEADGGTVACVTDVEYDGEPSAAAHDLASDADLLIHDAMETLVQVVSRRGAEASWPDDAAQLALESNAKRLLLYHHDPDLTDEKMLVMLDGMRSRHPGLDIQAAQAGDVVQVGGA